MQSSLSNAYFKPNNRQKIQSMAAETPADRGMVTTQATRISFAIPQFTCLYRSAAPTPITLPTTTWVVETGAPNRFAISTEAAAESWEFRLWSGRSL